MNFLVFDSTDGVQIKVRKREVEEMVGQKVQKIQKKTLLHPSDKIIFNMKGKKLKIYQMLNTLLIVSFLISINIFGQTVEEYEMHQLKAVSNLQKFGVYVWDFEGDKWNNKLTVSEIESFVKKALKGAGIKTVDFSEARGLKGAPNLEVSIKVDEKANSGVYSYSVIIRFIQDVKLLRNNIVNYGAITWERDDVSFAAEKDLDLEIRISINSLLDDFIADYQKVN